MQYRKPDPDVYFNDLKAWFSNESVDEGKVFEVSQFYTKNRLINDPGGQEVGMELFLFFEGGRGFFGKLGKAVVNGGKAAIDELVDIGASLFGRKVAQKAATSVGVKVLEEAPGVTHWLVSSEYGEVEVIANVTRDGDTLVLDGVHVQGSGANSIGPNGLNKMAKEFVQQVGKENGVKEVVVRPGMRTSGANPGNVPRPRVFKVQ